MLNQLFSLIEKMVLNQVWQSTMVYDLDITGHRLGLKKNHRTGLRPGLAVNQDIRFRRHRITNFKEKGK